MQIIKFFFGVLAAQPGGVTQQEAAMRRLSHARGVGRCPRGESAAARAGSWRGVGRCPRAESTAARAESRFGLYIATFAEHHFRFSKSQVIPGITKHFGKRKSR